MVSLFLGHIDNQLVPAMKFLFYMASPVIIKKQLQGSLKVIL